MSTGRYRLVFYAALLAAAGATFGVWRVLANVRSQSRIATRGVVVVTRDVAEGSVIDQTSLSVSQWPVATVPAGAFESVDSVVGRVTRVPVFTGEPVVPGRLAPPGTGPGLEVKITPGKRAMALTINDVTGIAGLIQPNSRVDVMVTLTEQGKAAGERIAKLFMSNMRVLSVGTMVDRGADGKPVQATTAALEVTPEESERLAIAASQGSIQLVLRGYGDPDTIKTTGAVSNDVLAQLRDGPITRPTAAPEPRERRPASRPAQPVVRMVQQPAPAPAAPKPAEEWTVNVYRGEKVTQQKFVKPDSSAKP
jgi:pilus assembly protein CpaB